MAQHSTELASGPIEFERGRQRHDAVDWHPPRRRLEADDAAHGGGNAHRAAGVGAERRHRHAVGHGDGRARRGTTRHALAVGRVARRAVMRVEAYAGEGELAHVGAADDHRAGRPQARHHGGVGLGGRGVAERLGTGKRRLARDVAEILDRDRDAGQRRGHEARFAQRIACIGGGQGLRAPDLDEGPLAFALGVVNAGEGFFGELARGGAAGGQGRREVPYGRICRRIGHRTPTLTCRGGSRDRRPPPDRPASRCRRDCRNRSRRSCAGCGA